MLPILLFIEDTPDINSNFNSKKKTFVYCTIFADVKLLENGFVYA